MRIRANNRTTRCAPERLLAAAAALALASGCDGAADTETTPVPADPAAAHSSAAQSCLLLVWDGQDAPEVDYDRANDQTAGGAISCATGASASQFRDAIEAIRTAARSGDREAMLREIGIPLLYIDAEGNRRDLGDGDTLDAVFDEVFDPATLEMLRNIELGDMTVEKDQGAFFELGSIWLAVPEPGARPRIVTVNRQALGEAAEAARRKALADPAVPSDSPDD